MRSTTLRAFVRVAFRAAVRQWSGRWPAGFAAYSVHRRYFGVGRHGWETEMVIHVQTLELMGDGMRDEPRDCCTLADPAV